MSITDASGNTLEEYKPNPNQVLPVNTRSFNQQYSSQTTQLDYQPMFVGSKPRSPVKILLPKPVPLMFIVTPGSLVCPLILPLVVGNNDNSPIDKKVPEL